MAKTNKNVKSKCKDLYFMIKTDLKAKIVSR